MRVCCWRPINGGISAFSYPPSRSGQFMTDQLSEELQYSQALVQPLLACLQVRARRCSCL